MTTDKSESNVIDSAHRWAERRSVSHSSAEGLKGGGGGGTFDGMEARVAKLESDMDYLKRDVSELRTDMRDVRDRTVRIESSMATKGFVFSVYGIIAGLLAAVVLFQAQIQSFFGVLPPTP